MTPQEKAKRYDEVLKFIKECTTDENGFITIYPQEVFPEIKVQDDEEIRKAIISGMNTIKKQGKETFAAIRINDCIAWLEKQGEQKPQGKTALEAINEEKVDNANKVEPKDYNSIDPYFMKPVDKVEPKFHKGDWVVNNEDGCICQITSIREDDYCLWPLDSDVEGYLKITDIDNKYHLYTIKDAKDGDVLAWNDSKCIAIFKNIYDEDSFNSYGFIGGYTGIFESRQSYHDIEGAHPATKKQREQLEKAMADAGYTFDFEKKELKKIKDETSIAVNNPDAYKIGFADGEAHAKEEQWKPNDEQIKHLTDVVYDAKHKNRIYTNGYEPYSYLYALLMQLKKLKG